MYKNILIPVLLYEKSDNRESYSVAPEIPIELMDQRNEAIRKSLEEALVGLPRANTKLISGHPGSMIVDFATENNVDCIIVKSHQPRIQDFFLGSTAVRVVRHAKCSVHVIR